MGLFSDLRERRLFRIVGGFAAGGWIAVEVVDQFVERGLLPEFVYLLVLIWYLAGLLGSAVFGWYHGEKGRQTWGANEIALLGGLGVVALILSGTVVERALSDEQSGVTAGGEGALDPRRLAVLYFEDLTGGELGHVADGLTESLIDELSTVPGLDVLSENAALHYRGRDLRRDSIAEALSAGTLVTGTVDGVGGAIRVNVALSDGASGVEFRRGTFERPGSDLLSLEGTLAGEVARFLREWLGEEVELRRGGEETDDVAAWAVFQRGERARKDGEDRLAEDDVAGILEAFTAADSLLAEAEALDPDWARPATVRARVALRLAQLSAGEPLEADAYIEAGLGHAARSLDRDPRFPAALEVRGMLRYLRWALALEPDPEEASRLITGAEEDLRAAVRFEPSRANAWNVLSIIASEEPDLVEAKIAARRAYEEDAYLRAADELLWTLYATSYDLEQFPDAVHFCDEGRRRFPDNPRFVECELWLLASRAREPDVDRAWSLVEEYAALSPPQSRERARLQGRIIAGGVLARAGLPDSADAVLRSSRGNPTVDPTRELLGLEAVFRLQMDQQGEALDLLKTYLTASPEHRAGWQWTSHWWWRPLHDDPEFQALVGG